MYTKWDKTKKVLASMQIIDASSVGELTGDFGKQTIESNNGGGVEFATGSGHRDNQDNGSDIANA